MQTTKQLSINCDTQGYRSGHNEAVLKTVCPQGRVGSNPTPCAFFCLKTDMQKKTKKFLTNEKHFDRINKLSQDRELKTEFVIGGGAGWYFKIYRPKKQQAAESEADYGGEYDGAEDYAETDPEDDGPPWDEDGEE